MGGTTPALMSPAVTRRSEDPTQTPSVSARVSLLGSNVDISVPTNEDRRKLTQVFSLLESTIKELKDENKHLRSEVQQLQDKVKHQQQPSPVLTVTSSSNIDNDQLKKLESDISTRIYDVVNRVLEIDNNNKAIVEQLDNKIES